MLIVLSHEVLGVVCYTATGNENTESLASLSSLTHSLLSFVPKLDNGSVNNGTPKMWNIM